jgi:cytosine deaminase
VRSRGVELILLDDQECIDMMAQFVKEKPELWNEDIGV